MFNPAVSPMNKNILSTSWFLTPLLGHELKSWLFTAEIPGLILGLVAPPLLHYPYKGWMALGHALGWVNSHIILGLVLIVVLQPIAFVMRITGYAPLRRRRKREITYRKTAKTMALTSLASFEPWMHFLISSKTFGTS